CLAVVRLAQHFGLVLVSGNAVQHERVLSGMESPGLGATVNEVVPKLDGRRVRDELATAGVLEENPTHWAIGFEAAENIAASAVEEIWNDPENFSLGPFSGAGGTEQQNGSITHSERVCFLKGWRSKKGPFTRLCV